MKNLQTIIEELQLKPHPEGGYYRETYRSQGEIDEACLGSGYKEKRSYATCIYSRRV